MLNVKNKFCPKCHEVYEEDVAYCPICSAKLKCFCSEKTDNPKKPILRIGLIAIVAIIEFICFPYIINHLAYKFSLEEMIGVILLLGTVFFILLLVMISIAFTIYKNKLIDYYYNLGVSNKEKEYEPFWIKRNEELEALRAEVYSLRVKAQSEKDSISESIFDVHKLTFSCENSAQYKSKLESIRTRQKDMIKAKTAVLKGERFAVNGDLKAGTKIIRDMQAVLLKSFNQECDGIISSVKSSNFDSSIMKITKSKDTVAKLGDVFGISISNGYYRLKLEELHLAYEYALKLQEEKEEQREIREELKEQARIQKEIEDELKKLEKEQTHYENVLESLNKQLEVTTDTTQATVLERRKEEIQTKIEETEKAMQDVDYRQANQRAGYVYIISNVGSFGEGVYKIGMTRRLNPQERIDELGSASVPFKFDVHAMIFSDDAPALEASLHRTFEKDRVNMINNRKEFFRVDLNEIKNAVHNIDASIEFTDVPEAEQFRASEQMRNDLALA